MFNKIERRIKYHTLRVRDNKERIKDVWTQYELETRRGLDERQLSMLLLWRKELISEGNALVKFHAEEALWLESLTNVPIK